jgi:glycine/D-amino acid oxidase-like deaminating enzyme
MPSKKNDRLADLGAPMSLWEATARPGPDTLPLRGTGRADVAVVGGGIAGLSTALHLAEAGVQVTLLESMRLGHGASSRNGGQVIPALKRDPEDLIGVYGREAAEPLIDFVGRTADTLFDLLARHRIDCNARRHGWIQAAHDEAAVRLVAERARQWGERGAPVEFLDADRTAAMTGATGYRGGWIDRRAGRLHPLDYTRGLARAAIGLGAALHEQSPVREILQTDGGWRLLTPEGEVKAEKVVLCMNAYANRAWPGLQRSYVPLATFQIASEPLDAATRAEILIDDIAVADTHPLLRYYRFDAAGRMLFGGGGSLRDLQRPSQVAPLLGHLDRLFPRLRATWRTAYYWGGSVALTLDHLPHLHDLGAGVYAYLGCNGRGVALATAMGGLLARLAEGESAKQIPFVTTPFRALALHAAYPLYIQAILTYHTVRERFRRPPILMFSKE